MRWFGRVRRASTARIRASERRRAACAFIYHPSPQLALGAQVVDIERPSITCSTGDAAVPVRNRVNRVVAAMNIGVHASRVSVEEMVARFLPVLQENAATFVHVLG